MTQIDARDNLAAIIRRQVSSLGRSPAGSPVAPRSGSESSSRKPASGDLASGSRDVAALVARRVKAIDGQDPQRRKKAFRVFLESVLLAELGENLINDAGFHQLVDTVHSHMDADSSLAAAIDKAADLMLSAAPKAAS